MKTTIVCLCCLLVFLLTQITTYGQCSLYTGAKWSSPDVTYKFASTWPSGWSTTGVVSAATIWVESASCFSLDVSSSSTNLIDQGPLGDVTTDPFPEFAATTATLNGAETEVLGCYTQFNNDPSVTWYTGSSATIPNGDADMETVALHEFGLWLALNETGSYSSVMGPYYFDYDGNGLVRRDLTDDVSECVEAIYCSTTGICETNCPLPAPTNFQAAVVGSDVHLSWDPCQGCSTSAFWTGLTLEINFSEVALNANATSYVDAGATARFPLTYRIVANGMIDMEYTAQSASPIISFSPIPGGWDMLSVPSILKDFSKSSVWPTAKSPAWQLIDGSYAAADPVTNGPGYWVDFQPGQPQTVKYAGDPLDQLGILVHSGWNIIGAMHLPINTATIVSTPTGNINSPYFGYAPNSGYYLAPALQAGSGYWVNVNETGILTLDPTSTANNPPPIIQVQPPSPPGAPPTPVPLSPSNGATGQPLSLTLSWSSSTGATKYHMRAASDQNFNNLIYDNSNLTVTYASLGGLSYDSTYYWEVNASDSVTSQWSNIFKFTTQDPPSGGGGGCQCCASSISSLDQLTVSDYNGYSQKLYLVNGNRFVDLGFTNYGMPPPPPRGIFNARFSSGNLIETIVPNPHAQTRVPILIKDATLPLVLSWDLRTENALKYVLTLPGVYGQTKVSLDGQTGSMVIGDSGNGVLNLSVQPMQIAPCPPAQVTVKQGGENEELHHTPAGTKLLSNYPNPFNPSTTLPYQLNEPARVQIKVYNLLGEEVAKLVDDEWKGAGYYSVTWNATKMASGVYYVRMVATDISAKHVYQTVEKLVLMK